MDIKDKFRMTENKKLVMTLNTDNLMRGKYQLMQEINQLKQENPRVHVKNEELMSKLLVKDSMIRKIKTEVLIMNSDVRSIKMESNKRILSLEDEICMVVAKNESIAKNIADKY